MLVVIFGTGRCGSTPITEVICRHRDVGFVSNLDDKLPQLNLKGTWNNVLHRLSPPRDPKMRPLRDRTSLVEWGRFRIAPSEAWNVLDRQIAPVMSTPFRDLLAEDCTPWLTRRLHDFFERRMAAQHRHTFVQHLTGWPRAGFIRAAFPDARFIHVVRDGRAVANSWLQMGWWRGYGGPTAWHLGQLPKDYADEWERSDRSFVVLAGLGWKLLIEAFERARAEVPPGQWMQVRYEDVIADPRRHVGAMLDFVGLQWTADFERQFVGYPFVGGRVEGFRRDLDADSLAALERTIASTLRSVGYQTSVAGGVLDSPAPVNLMSGGLSG
jgi:hypothetical protein